MTPSGNALENGELLPNNYPQLLYQAAELAITPALKFNHMNLCFHQQKRFPFPLLMFLAQVEKDC